MTQARSQTQLGLLAALGTQLIWGFLPLWTALFPHTPPMQMLAYRIVFCLLTGLAFIAALKQGSSLAALLRAPSRWRPYLISAALIGVNWYVFFDAVQQGRILEVSFAYYLLPLLTIGMGVVFLAERLNKWTAAGLVAAAIGVVAMSQSAAGIPWLGIVVALTFSSYTLVRKQNPIEPLIGLTFETAALAPLALALFFFGAQTGTVNPGDSISHLFWLASFGPQTLLSMSLFNFATHRLRMATLGALQFVSPTIALFVALIGGEHMSQAKLWGFVCIWIGVAFYIVDALKARAAHKQELAQSIASADLR